MLSILMLLSVTSSLVAIKLMQRRANKQYVSPSLRLDHLTLADIKRTYRQQVDTVFPLIAIAIVTVVIAISSHGLMVWVFPDDQPMALVVAISLLITSYLLLNDFSHLSGRKFEVQLIESIDVMRSALNAHLGMRHALQLMATSADGKIKLELSQMLERYDAGQPVGANVNHLLSKQSGSAVRMFCHALVVYDEDGVDLSHLLDETSRLLRERLRSRHQIETQLAGTKYAAMFAGALPYMLIPIFVQQEPAWFQSLTQHTLGAEFITGGVLMQTFGVLWLRRSTRVPL